MLEIGIQLAAIDTLTKKDNKSYKLKVKGKNKQAWGFIKIFDMYGTPFQLTFKGEQ